MLNANAFIVDAEAFIIVAAGTITALNAHTQSL